MVELSFKFLIFNKDYPFNYRLYSIKYVLIRNTDNKFYVLLTPAPNLTKVNLCDKNSSINIDLWTIFVCDKKCTLLRIKPKKNYEIFKIYKHNKL